MDISTRFAASAALVTSVAVGHAQSFVDGNFASGNLNAWTVANTPNGYSLWEQVDPVDIDFSGTAVNAADFSVGVSAINGTFGGITLTQSLNLTAGSSYKISYDWRTLITDYNANVECGVFDLVVNGKSVARFDSGNEAYSFKSYGVLSGTYVAPLTGTYSIGAMITRDYGAPSDLHQYVDNFNIVSQPIPEPAPIAALGVGVLGLMYRKRRSH